MSLQGKKIVLGICGGIAAYKSAFLLRLLVREGAEVKVVMTPDSTAFVGPLTFSTLSKNPVAIEFFNPTDGSWNNHVALGNWGDLMLIAPATANTISSMAHGRSNNFLLAVYLSARCPVVVAPAMDLDMWQHAATQNNVEQLKKYGSLIINPGTGELASGLTGEGRMAEPEEIVNVVKNLFSTREQKLKGKKVLITAGPTYEAIDPVRYIGNRSSGKMGFALAAECLNQGAEVIVIHGPVAIGNPDPRIVSIAIETADEMLDACKHYFNSCDVFIAAAAVSDFKPVQATQEKIKKSADNESGMSINFTRTPDILSTLSQMKSPGQLIIGFALETNNALENARDKLTAKNLDMIVINSTTDEGAGFGHDTNKISILDRQGKVTNFELKHKNAVAADIIHYLTEQFNA